MSPIIEQNMQDVETKTLLIEDAEAAKQLANLSPSHPSRAALQSRRTAIKTTLDNKSKPTS